ncbi:MAG: ATP-binding protein [Saprospiraceae bacterium]
MTIAELRGLKESEDNVEFKAARNNFKYDGGKNSNPKDRRHCVLGYVSAFCNEGGGMLVLGMGDKEPHEVVGSNFAEGLEGQLVDKIYNDIGIRVRNKVLFDSSGKRVLILVIPGRPVGKIIKFEGVGLMRTGESLRAMSDEETFSILSEREPDFSDTICKRLTIDDLDENAISELKTKYSNKQKNQNFLTLSNEQVLSDLSLLRDGRLTYAALILLGKEKAIRTFLPQSNVFVEYRLKESSITSSDRKEFGKGLFSQFDDIWNFINLRNDKFPVQEGFFMLEISSFNQEVVREGILNAIAHRDYSRASEILIKQSPNGLIISSPGGLPSGVTVENILTTNSTPRNRLLTEVLLKTGLVERSGQGVDKMFYQNIIESKEVPDYSQTDSFQVVLKLSALVLDPAFVLFVRSLEGDVASEMGVLEVVNLNMIRQGKDKSQLDREVVQELLKLGLVEKRGATNNLKYVLSKSYYEFTNQKGKYTSQTEMAENKVTMLILDHLRLFETATMTDFFELFDGKLTKRQLNYRVNKLIERGALERTGSGKGTVYKTGKRFKDSMEIFKKAFDIGMQKLKADGEIE